jgi:hypothetical protein
MLYYMFVCLLQALTRPQKTHKHLEIELAYLTLVEQTLYSKDENLKMNTVTYVKYNQ